MTAPIETAAELYREMKQRGLHLRAKNGRDNALLSELTARLQCPDKRLQSFLDDSGLSAEAFLRAFLEVAQPFAKMFSEIWDFLSAQCAPRAGETLALRFGFSGSPDACTLEWDQFRRYVETTRTVTAWITVRLWPIEALHKLFSVARVLLPRDASPWQTYERHGAYHPGNRYVLPVPGSASHRFDRVLADVASLFQWIIGECAAETERPEAVRRLPELHEQSVTDNEAYGSLRNAAGLLTDLLPTWVYILERSGSIPADRKSEALALYQREIQPLLKSKEAEAQVRVLKALDILDLPFWRHRWHTYEVWSTVATLRAMGEYRPAIRVKEGYIPLDGYSAAIVADLVAKGYTSSCVALQAETPLEKYGRKGIKPDLRICFSDDLAAESTAAVVELKQRRKPERKQLEEVARSYLEGSPRSGGVIILNYDTPHTPVCLPANCFLLEGVQPCNQGAVDRFENALNQILQAAGFLPVAPSTVVLLDVSGSMRGQYEPEDVQGALGSLLAMKWVRVLRFNDGLVPGGDLDESSYRAIGTSGGTQLGPAITEVEKLFGLPKKMLVVTDGGHEHPTEILSKIDDVRECTPQELAQHLWWLEASS
jgi:hypothetical protein